MARAWLALALLPLAAATGALAVDPGPHVPEVALGFAVAPLGAVGVFEPKPIVPIITAVAFHEGDLYAATTVGEVVRVPLAWTLAGPIAGAPELRAKGFNVALGLAFAGEALYVSDSHPGLENDRTDGRVTRLLPGQATQPEGLVVVEGLPNGLHHTNHLRFGPDGRLYIANGNSNDNGIHGGSQDVFPYSGAILSVDPAVVGGSPAVLHWEDEAGAAIPVAQIAAHPRNADFHAKVRVEAWGLRNAFGLTFARGELYTAVNGPEAGATQDWLLRVDRGADHGFPPCHFVGAAGATGAGVRVVPSPLYNDPARCVGIEPATALLGWHVCPTGIDAPGPGWPAAFRDSLYIAECGGGNPYVVFNLLDEPSLHDIGHKVVRVPLDAAGEAVEVRDFLTGLATPTDVVFGPDGAMYVADALVVYRVAPVL